jgi:plastocyanin
MLLIMLTLFYLGRIMRSVFFVFALLAGVVLISGCTDYQTQTPGEVETTEVMMQNYRFLPQDIRVSAGDTVTWTNNDRVIHNVVADNGEFDSGDLAPGETFTFTFEEAGAISYSCTIHPGMIGSVTVVTAE